MEAKVIAMDTHDLNSQTLVTDLLKVAFEADGPVVLTQDGEECLVIMSPKAFEDLLFASFSLDGADRSSLHF